MAQPLAAEQIRRLFTCHTKEIISLTNARFCAGPRRWPAAESEMTLREYRRADQCATQGTRQQ